MRSPSSACESPLRSASLRSLLTGGPDRATRSPMLDVLRTTLHRALVTPVGDSVTPVRVTKDLARRLNLTLGQPICSAEALQTRRHAQEKLDRLARDPR